MSSALAAFPLTTALAGLVADPPSAMLGVLPQSWDLLRGLVATTGGLEGDSIVASVAGSIVASVAGSMDATVATSLDVPLTASVLASVTGSIGGVFADFFQIQLVEDILAALEATIHTARGWAGLSIIFVYSFLIAFVLPGPSEVVLAAPLELGIGLWPTLAVIMLVSATGKAVGSVFAFHIGQEAKEAGPIIRALERSRFDVMEWSRARTVEIAREYGYAGLAVALMVPFFPDTLSIYAFAVLERDYWRFALATFAGSLGRLLITIGLFSGTAVVV